MTHRKFARPAATIAALALAATGLAACSGGGDDATSGAGSSDGAAGSSDALEAALEAGGEITYWTWTPSGEDQAKAFMDAYPNVTVNVVNAGTNTEEYTKLSNAIKAGSGAPDVAQVEYYAIPQFALTDSLLDLSGYGFSDLKDDYSPGPWDAVTDGDQVWGLPQDSGPMALFYDKDVFDQAGVTEVPTTWDEYYEAAKKIRALGDDYYITSDSGDAGFVTSMIWQAGGTPFTADGTDVTVDFAGDEGTRKFTENWNRMIQEDLVNTGVSGWSDEWFQGLGKGTIASLLTGAWMPGNLIANAPEGSGKWRVAPMPTYDGAPANSENGGSAQVVVKQSKNPELAAAFLKWLNNSDESVRLFLESGGFPSTTKDMESDEFLKMTNEYFGDQAYNEVLVEGAGNVIEGFQYTPFQVYANSIFGDTVGAAYQSKSDISAALDSWGESMVKYGNEQGFTVK